MSFHPTIRHGQHLLVGLLLSVRMEQFLFLSLALGLRHPIQQALETPTVTVSLGLAVEHLSRATPTELTEMVPLAVPLVELVVDSTETEETPSAVAVDRHLSTVVLAGIQLELRQGLVDLVQVVAVAPTDKPGVDQVVLEDTLVVQLTLVSVATMAVAVVRLSLELLQMFPLMVVNTTTRPQFWVTQSAVLSSTLSMQTALSPLSSLNPQCTVSRFTTVQKMLLQTSTL